LFIIHVLIKYQLKLLDTRVPDRSTEPTLCFMSFDLGDVFHHEDDLVVIFVIIMGRNVHRVLVDQGSSTDEMFWEYSPICSYPLIS